MRHIYTVIIFLVMQIGFNACSNSTSKEYFVIHEINTISGTLEKKYEYSSKGVKLSLSSSQNEIVAIKYDKKRLNEILEDLNYKFNKNNLKSNPILIIDYDKSTISRGKAIKEIIGRLKLLYDI